MIQRSVNATQYRKDPKREDEILYKSPYCAHSIIVSADQLHRCKNNHLGLPQMDGGCGLCSMLTVGKCASRNVYTYASDDYPYYGINTIIPIECRLDFHPTPQADRDIPPRPRARGKYACNQRFYMTYRNAILSASSICSTCHLNDNYPIYTVIAALELATGKRFDHPLPIYGGACVAFNRDEGLICVVDGDEQHERDVYMSLFEGKYRVAYINGSDVHRYVMTSDFNADVANETIARAFISIARIVYNSISGTFTCMPLEQIIQRVASRRLLPCTVTDADRMRAVRKIKRDYRESIADDLVAAAVCC